MKNKKRLRLAYRVIIFLGFLSMYSIYTGLETVATTCVAGILTVATMYIGGDSYRPSEKEEVISEQNN